MLRANRSDRIPFLPGRSMVLVAVQVNELDALALLVDTGAQNTVLSPESARRLSLDVAHPIRSQVLVGIGRTAAVPVVRINQVRVGASEVANLEVSIFDLPPLLRADGLLGLDFLRRFRASFEFDRRTLVLRSPVSG